MVHPDETVDVLIGETGFVAVAVAEIGGQRRTLAALLRIGGKCDCFFQPFPLFRVRLECERVTAEKRLPKLGPAEHRRAAAELLLRDAVRPDILLRKFRLRFIKRNRIVFDILFGKLNRHNGTPRFATGK